ncbi:MAG: hypothetical protein NVSMB1_07720 [Polyangiales bacterium]
MFLWVLVPSLACTLACSGRKTHEHPSTDASKEPIVTVTLFPKRDDGRASRSLRIGIDRALSTTRDAGALPRILLIAGGADPIEVEAMAKGRASEATRSREIPFFSWIDSTTTASTIYAQPNAPLSPGKATLVLLFPHQPPFSQNLDVADEPSPALRVWPSTESSPTAPWTFCLDADAATRTHFESDLDPVVLSPSFVVADLLARTDTPCIDVKPRSPLPVGLHVAPPILGSIGIDPAPVTIAPSPPPRANEPCAQGDVTIGSICARIDDDRLVLLGNGHSEGLLLGSIDTRPLVAPLDPFARFVVRDLSASSPVQLACAIRDARGETTARTVVQTAAAHRHFVINEVLSRPPSAASTQRFVELVNDGNHGASLYELQLIDSATTHILPNIYVAPGNFALVVPDGFVEGLSGDDAPPPKTPIIRAGVLKLNALVTLLERDGRVLSRFPIVTSTRKGSRGRRTPERPDDARDAFGWDAKGRATPGRVNEISPISPP